MWSLFLRNCVVVSLLLTPFSVFGAVVVSEIMFDTSGADTGREWIEIMNTGAASVDITGWKLLENGVNHKITPQGGSVIPPGGYAVLVGNTGKFLADWPGYSGLLFQSSFSLKNSGETLSIKNASSSELTSVSYVGGSAAGDGNSLNVVNGTFVTRKPSPGASISAETIQPPPAKSASKPGTGTALSKVPTTDGATYGAVSREDGSEQDVSYGNEAGETDESFAMLPWIVGLIAVIGIAGAAVFLSSKKPPGSGYTIIEEK